MKVCTDSCLFGAWVALQEEAFHSASVMDAGSGTGLLSLMLAQKLKDAVFTAVEPDPGSYEDCLGNFASSPWPARLRVLPLRIQAMDSFAQGLFDVVVCNPPFFLSHLPSPSPGANLARHLDVGTLQDWVARFQTLTHPRSRMYFLLPPHTWIQLKPTFANSGWNASLEVKLRQGNKGIWRNLIQLKREPIQTIETWEYPVYDASGKFSPVIHGWMSEYYLPQALKSTLPGTAPNAGG